MTAQLDLFSGDQPRPPPAFLQSVPIITATPRPVEIIPTPPTVEWARLLARHTDVSTRVMVQCSALYTGLVLESLALGPAGQHLLMADRTIREIAPDPGRHARYVYMRPREAIALHAQHPMVVITTGSHSCTYRFAEPGEAAPAELQLPPATIGPEIG